MSFIGSGIPLTHLLPPIVVGSAASPSALCPKCKRKIDIADGPNRCKFCRWKGEIYQFNPLPITVEHPEQALAEDATCLHHPAKKAVAVCAGTGDYICALCAVELNGETFSAAYLNNAGKAKATQAFATYLERPDTTIITLIICCFVPYVNFAVIPASIFWLPYAGYLYIKSLRMRRADPLYARVMGKGRVIVLPILLALIAAAWIVGLVILITKISGR